MKKKLASRSVRSFVCGSLLSFVIRFIKPYRNLFNKCTVFILYLKSLEFAILSKLSPKSLSVYGLKIIWILTIWCCVVREKVRFRAQMVPAETYILSTTTSPRSPTPLQAPTLSILHTGQNIHTFFNLLAITNNIRRCCLYLKIQNKQLKIFASIKYCG